MAATAQPKIFKKIEVVEGGGHHGGGWKVAYADFMTAMMAFFLLMWILASSDEQKLRGIAEYFTNATLPGGSGVLDGATLGPPGTLTASNGSVVARGSELGKIDDPSPAQWEVRDVTPTSDPQQKILGTREGEHENPAAADISEEHKKKGKDSETAGQATNAAEVDIEAEHPIDDMKFKELQQDIMQSMQNNPDLQPLTQNVIFEQTPEGLHIQIIDQEGKPMFRSGKADMVGATQTLLSNLGQSLAELPNKVILSGHTDAVPFANSAKYDNWDLSSDRANATRRVFEAAGVDRERIIRVSGMADTELLVPENPTDPSNRRISIMVQYRTTEESTNMAKPMQKAEMEDKSEMMDDKQMSSDTKAEMKMEKPAMDAAMQKGEATAMQETQHAADHTQPAPVPLGDQVFQNLRNALR